MRTEARMRMRVRKRMLFYSDKNIDTWSCGVQHI